eukprot:378663-Amphidinium_carterae.2
MATPSQWGRSAVEVGTLNWFSTKANVGRACSSLSRSGREAGVERPRLRASPPLGVRRGALPVFFVLGVRQAHRLHPKLNRSSLNRVTQGIEVGIGKQMFANAGSGDEQLDLGFGVAQGKLINAAGCALLFAWEGARRLLPCRSCSKARGKEDRVVGKLMSY